MFDLIETIVVRISNWFLSSPTRHSNPERGLHIGSDHSQRPASPSDVFIRHHKRAEHIAVLGRTGAGKSSLLRHFTKQDVEQDRGFVHFDLHGEMTPYVLQVIAAEEQRRGQDLSGRLIVVEPADREYAVGINVLGSGEEYQAFVQIGEVAQLLKQRWHLEAFGARTEELLRNALLVLTECGLTLLEVSALLTNRGFRAQCLARVRQVETRAYFAERYDPLSDPMQSAWRDAILNKLSTFTADPHFRHMLGQTQSAFSVLDALDRGYWVLLNLDKGRLGEHAATLGGLFLTAIKNAVFARRTHTLITLYADELQNLVAYDSGIETLLAEARKRSVSVCCANQFLEQYPPSMRAAVMAVGTHMAFQLSSADADRMATAFGGGHHLQALLKNLPPRHVVVKSGHRAWRHVVVPQLDHPSLSSRSLYERSRARWARPRATVEAEIVARQPTQSHEEALHDWD